MILIAFQMRAQEVYEVEILPPTQRGIMEAINGEMVKILVGNVKLRHKGTYIDCDSAIIYSNNNIEAFGRVKIWKTNKTKLEGDHLSYLSLQRVAIIRGNVIISDKNSKLYTEDVTYDLNVEVGQYLTGGKLVTNQSEITSQTGTYYAKDNLVLFKQNVHINHPKYKLDSDSLMYNTKLKRSIFRTSTKIESDSGYIWCNSGWYDEENKLSSFGKGTYIYNPPNWMLTDSIYYDRSKGVSHIFKTFEYHDTAAKMHLFGDSAYMYNDNKDFTAYHRPTLIMESSDNKPTFIRGKTLYSQSLPLNHRRMKVVGNVKMYNKDFQAISDTIIYLSKDSSINMNKDAFVWHEKYQISGDHLLIYMENKKPKQMNVYGHSFLANEEESYGHYNQVSSDTNYIYFLGGKLDYLYARGNTKSIYYGKEEGKGYLGLNSSESYSLKMLYQNGEVDRVIFYETPKAIFYPVKEINDGNRFLSNFLWNQKARPNSKDEL